jgi:hypothetical protein
VANYHVSNMKQVVREKFLETAKRKQINNEEFEKNNAYRLVLLSLRRNVDPPTDRINFVSLEHYCFSFFYIADYWRRAF